MTIPVFKIKILPKPVIKGKMDVRFPASVVGAEFIAILKANGTYTLGVDYTLLDPTAFADPGTTYVAVLDGATGSYKITSLSALVAATTQMDQHITDAGPVSVLPNAGIVRVDQSAGAAITLNMPLASVKTCPVLISDWKGDAATNNITISLTGSDKFPGGLTSWTIAADTGSVFLRPVPGAGYAL